MFRFKNAITTFGAGAPALKSATSGTEEADRVGPLGFDSPSSSDIQDSLSPPPAAPYLLELTNSRTTRQSRASSIVSTQTKFSTNTALDDARSARSIDINVAGQYFRISRDGSRITADAPPPYTPANPPIDEQARAQDDHDYSAERERLPTGLPGGAYFDSRYAGRAVDADSQDQDSEPEDGATTPRSIMPPANPLNDLRANILNPAEVDMPSPVGPDRLSHRASTATLTGNSTTEAGDLGVRTPSYRAGGEILSLGSDARRTRTVSDNNLSWVREARPHSSPLRRRNGVRLPTLFTGLAADSDRAAAKARCADKRSSRPSLSPLQIKSAGPVLSSVHNTDEPQSPNYIGRNARGVFPSVNRSSPASSVDMQPIQHSFTTGLRPFDRERATGNVAEESTSPLAMDDENDISLHYARLMRKLDYGHRKALHLRDKELAELRQGLHEKDMVLRQQLRAKDFMIDDLKKRLAHLEQNLETMIEKARNEVEDLWESRWKDRDFHLRERMRRIEEEAAIAIEKLRVSYAGRCVEPVVPAGSGPSHSDAV